MRSGRAGHTPLWGWDVPGMRRGEAGPGWHAQWRGKAGSDMNRAWARTGGAYAVASPNRPCPMAVPGRAGHAPWTVRAVKHVLPGCAGHALWLGRACASVRTCKRCGWIVPALWPGRPGHAHWPNWSCFVACAGPGMRHGRAGGADMSRGQAGQGMGRGRAWSAGSAPWLAQVLP
jgi:hypothetical protein